MTMRSVVLTVAQLAAKRSAGWWLWSKVRSLPASYLDTLRWAQWHVSASTSRSLLCLATTYLHRQTITITDSQEQIKHLNVQFALLWGRTVRTERGASVCNASSVSTEEIKSATAEQSWRLDWDPRLYVCRCMLVKTKNLLTKA